MCTRQAEGRHSPWSRDIFEKLSLPNGERQERWTSEEGGEYYSRYSKGRKSNFKFVRGQGNPGTLYHPPRSLLFPHHYQSGIFSHVHVPLEPLSDFLPRRVPQPSRQPHPRRYRQVFHPVWCKLGPCRISLSQRLWQLLQRHRVLKLVASRLILRMQRLQFVRQIFQFEFRFFRPVEPVFW